MDFSKAKKRELELLVTGDRQMTIAAAAWPDVNLDTVTGDKPNLPR